MMDWFEELPPSCPEDGAEPPKGEVFFRLLGGDEITDEDFWSHRKLWPHKAFNTDECKARAVSVFKSFSGCERLLSLPVHAGKKVAQISLGAESGLIKRTFNTKGHYSWWRRKDFDPVPVASMAVNGGGHA